MYKKIEPIDETLTPSLSSGELMISRNFFLVKMTIDSCFTILDELVNVDRRQLISRNFSWKTWQNRSALIQAYLTDPGTIPDALIWRKFFTDRRSMIPFDLTGLQRRRRWFDVIFLGYKVATRTYEWFA